MIFKRILSVSCGIILGMITLYILEGACFRFVEDYAFKRLRWAWGNYLQGSTHPILRKFPLDHFAEPPSLEKKGNIYQECVYSSRVMSFSLPQRDRYLEFIHSENDPLKSFDIRDLQSLRGVITPGLTRPAMHEDVRDGLARRTGDPLEYAEGFFIFVTSVSSNSDYEYQFAQWEKTFAFLLNEGMACLLLATNSLEDLMGKISFLKADYPLLSENLVVFGRGEQASLVMEACHARPSFYRGIIVENPTRTVPCPREISQNWFLAHLDEASIKEKLLINSIMDWSRKARESEFLYPSRLGGLIRQEVQKEASPLPSFAISYALMCKEYFSIARMLFAGSPPANEIMPMLLQQHASVEPKIDAPQNLKDDPYRKLEEPKASSGEIASFNCEMVNEYRRIHADDPGVSNLSNRELILQIGQSFESMGEQVMEQIKLKDPLFLRYYFSLKELGL
jgi:hypothetical protein